MSDGRIVTNLEAVTLPNSNGDYSLLGELQTEVEAQAVQVRFPVPVTGIASLASTSTARNTASIQNPQSGGLSRGTKIAIGVSIPVAVLLFLAGAFLGFRWRARRHVDTQEAHNKPELSASSAVDRQNLVRGGGSTNNVELGVEETQVNRAEMGGEGGPIGGAELDGEERLEAASRPIHEAGGHATS